jgi:Family of unknown function (DUF6214)
LVPRKRRDPEIENAEEPEEEPETVTMVPIGEGRYVPQFFTFGIQDEPYRADLFIEVRNREAICTFIALRLTDPDGAPIRKEDLRAVPLGEWIKVAVAGTAVSREAEPTTIPLGATKSTEIMAAMSRQDVDALFAGLQAGDRKRITDDVLQEVARVYREAVAAGEPPTVAVQRHMGRSRSTAGRLVMQARQRGFLGRARARMAGELVPPSKTTGAKKKGRKQ